MALELMAGDAAGSHRVPSQAALDVLAGSYPVPDGYTVLPAPTPGEYTALMQLKEWKNVRIAHKFDDRWYDGRFDGRWRRPGPYQDYYEVYYRRRNNDSVTLPFAPYTHGHALTLDTYGVSKLWVRIAKEQGSL